MRRSKKIVLVGGGGHAKVVIDAIKESKGFSIYGIVDNGLKKGSSVSGIKVVGKDDVLPSIFKRGIRYAFTTVGSIGNCDIRKKIYRHLKRIGFELPVIMHPKAVVSKNVSFGEGAFVAGRVVINPATHIGKNAIINTASSVDHDCVIGDFVHIAPGVTLSGGIEVGDETHIGTGANIIQYIKIGKRCMIGAGTTVRHNMADGTRNVDRLKRKKRVFIIAEVGVNHNGKIAIAKKMIDIAKDAGADAVKFQTFKAESFISKFAPKAEYQKKRTRMRESQLDMVKRLEFDVDEHKELIRHCKKRGIIFLSSPFDLESIDLLNNLGLKIFKIPSGEIVNVPYLRKIGSLGKKVIMSTGMADLEEIKSALNILVESGTPKENITILHCNTEYPSPFRDVNLLAMSTIKDALKVGVGYSDHTLGIEIPIAAATLGATVIEKHFTLDKDMAGPDHKASLEPLELKRMVEAIRNIEKAFGDGVKRPSPSELRNIKIIRKSIVAKRDIKKGEFFTEENITAKRPATGLNPFEWDNIIGERAKKDFRKDRLVEA